MSLYKIQGKAEQRKGIYYEFNSEDEPLGEGGMGKVYKGRCVNEQNGSWRYVAVKFMYSDLPEHVIERARREAAIQIRHDNLVEMLGFIETEETTVLGEIRHRYHVVSELLEGVTLDHLFEGKLTDQNGNFVPYAEKLYNDYKRDAKRFAIGIVRNILSGLMALHDAGYIHRDIDPTNIMITADGHIKLIDFGIAKKMNTLTTHDKQLTQAGVFMGKPEYASPELVLGAISEQNQATDIYAVGILLFQCIVGHPPFEGDRYEVLKMQQHSAMPLKLIKDKGVRKIIATATEKVRSKRFGSAAEFRVALERLSRQETAGGFAWKPLYGYVAAGVVACGVAALFLLPDRLSDAQSSDPDTLQPDPVPTVQGATYASAVAALHDSTTSASGMETLQSLSEQAKNADATYLLSRLYFRSLLPDDYCPDSIREMRRCARFPLDNRKAHDLLEKTIDQNPKHYQALYELACDYWKADQRTEAVAERDAKKAAAFFLQARNYAEQAGDRRYVGMVDYYLRKIKEWQANVEMIKSQR